MANKLLFLASSSAILIVMVVAFTVVVGSVNADVTTTTTSVDSMCEATYYKQSCSQTLTITKSSTASSTPLDYFKAAVDAVIKGVTASLQSSEEFGKKWSDDKHKRAMEYCRGLFDESIELLQITLEQAGSLQGLAQNQYLVTHWISAVTSLTHGCADAIGEPELQKFVDTSLENTTELASNAIALIQMLAKAGSGIPGIESIENQFFNNNSSSGSGRRLLEEEAEEDHAADDDELHEVDEHGYPKWLPAGDRKLVEAKKGPATRLTPKFVVAQDGSGNFKTINEAVKATPSLSNERTVIYVKAGIYKEQVIIPKEKTNIYMYGDGGRKTVVTGSKNAKGGYEISDNPTFAVEGKGTILRFMKFENTAGPEGHQAVALRVKADMVAVVNCHIYAYQDTLYAHAYRQYYRGCIVVGTVDFIFGDAAMILQKCTILIRKGLLNQNNMMTAQGRTIPNGPTGIIIHDCQILPHKDLEPVRLTYENYLARPWKKYSKAVFMQSTIGDLIRPEGYHIWDGASNHQTAEYYEFGNTGPGADTSKRVKWPKVKTIDANEAMRYTVGSKEFLDGSSWLSGTGTKYMSDLKK